MIKRFFYSLSERWYLDAKEDMLFILFASVCTTLGFTMTGSHPPTLHFLEYGIDPVLLGKTLQVTAIIFWVLTFVQHHYFYKLILSAVAYGMTGVILFLRALLTNMGIEWKVESSLLLILAFTALFLCGLEVVRLCQRLTKT